MISYLVALLGMSALDSSLSFLFPFDTSYVTMSIVPSLAFMTLAVLSRRIPFRQSIILAAFLGCYQDLYINQTFLLYLSVYVAVIVLANLWSKSISSSIFEEVLFVITTLFVKELVLYFIMTVSNATQISILQWFWKRELLTVIVHSFCSFFVFRIVDALQRFLENQDETRRKGENVRWLQLRLREEKKNYKSLFQRWIPLPA